MWSWEGGAQPLGAGVKGGPCRELPGAGFKLKHHLPPWASSSSLFASGSSSENEEANSCVTRTGALDKRVMVGHRTPRKRCGCPCHHHRPRSFHLHVRFFVRYLPQETQTHKNMDRSAHFCVM